MSKALKADFDEYTRNYRKLLPKTVGPFQVVSTTDDTVFIKEDGIENGIRIHQVTRASRRPLCGMCAPRPTTTPGIDPDGPYGDETVPLPAPTTDDTNQTAVVDRLVRQEHRPDRTYYRVRWFACAPAEIKLKPPGHIPQHSNPGYWKWITGTRWDNRMNSTTPP